MLHGQRRQPEASHGILTRVANEEGTDSVTRTSEDGYTTIEVDLDVDLRDFMLGELCRRDMRPSEWVSEVLWHYIETVKGQTNED